MKFILILLLLFPVFNSINVFSETSYSGKNLSQNSQQVDTRQVAFNILRRKCNSCHATKKRVDIFTIENMVVFAPKIYEQVFVKKKMPKGRKVQLTEQETQHLKGWIETVLKVK